MTNAPIVAPMKMATDSVEIDASRETAEDEGADIEITLGVLNAVGENSALTQRSIASELNIALGLANAYLKRCIRKGLIKVKQAPRNRYAYYLTPHGFAEKSRLTSAYLSVSFNFFRHARNQCSTVLKQCADKGWTRIALAGCSDVAEIATLCAREHGIEIVGILNAFPNAANGAPRTEFLGLPVVDNLTGLGNKVKAILVTDIDRPQEVFDRLSESIPSERVLTIALLKVSRQHPNFGD
jgi:DNA-binding MarR family transcriptional regulator